MKTLLPARSSDRIGNVNGGGFLRRPYYFYRVIFLCAIFACAAALGSRVYAAPSPGVPAASAASILGKYVRLNGSPMPAGATLFPGDVVSLGEGSTAALRFGSSLVFAAPLTELQVQSSGVSLREGHLQVRADAAESFTVSAPYFQVNLASFGGVPSSAEIRLQGTSAQISAVAGAADLTTAGSVAPYRLNAGETANLDAASADASAAQTSANPAAGQVSRLLPQVQIDRASQHIVASVSDRVYWNDGLRSGPTGRAHITLKDGSQLNLGSDSSLRILQHDAQAQQTSLDLLLGRMRGKITKLTRPGAKFEIHTPLGVAGLVGTDMSLLVTDNFVELMVFEGTVRFTTLDGKTITVTAGNKVRISKNGSFEGPTPTTPQEVQIAQNLTDITGPGEKGAVVAATSPTVPLIVTLTGSAIGVGIGVWQGTRPTVSTSIP